jgi:uridine phosphorylase
MPPSRTVEADPAVVQKLVKVLEKHSINYEVGKTWTMDAFYRETKGKIAKRKKEGCLTVEMECSALLAIAKYRNVMLGQYLLAGDYVGGTLWDQRPEGDLLSSHQKMFWLSSRGMLNPVNHALLQSYDEN